MALKELHLKILNKRKWQTICSLALGTRSPKMSVLKSLFVKFYYGYQMKMNLISIPEPDTETI